MKKFLIASGVAVVAFASIAAAQGYQFSTNLTVGSTGPDVVALQTWLIANGHHIPAIESGAAAKGYFGSQTKSAVAQFQAASGLPSTGFFGPLTRGVLNGGSVASTGGTTAVTCPAGYVCTAVPGTTPSNPAGPVGISTPGVPGTLAASLWNSPSDGTTVYKGQSYDVVAYKLQASASDMAVQSISLDFDTRLWLYAGTITVKDDQGNVVAQVNNLNMNNFTELTVGSDYRITIPVSNYVVKAATTRYLTVNVGFLAVTDRSSGTLHVTQAQIRSVDGTGVTDTETVNSSRSFTFQGSGAGQVVVTVNGSSPLAGLVQISTGAPTNNVPLAIYDVKSQSVGGNLRAITFVVNTVGGKTPEQMFQQYNLKIDNGNGNVVNVGANSVTPNTSGANAASSTIVFTNFGSIPLAADTYAHLTLMANVQQDTNNNLDGISASTTLTAAGSAGGTTNNPDIEDQSYSQLAVNSGVFISSNLTFSGSSATLSNLTATPGSTITCPSGSTTVTCGLNMSFSFTLTAGNSTLFLSSDTNKALATSTTGLSPAATASSSLTTAGITANPGQIAGDNNINAANGYYVIPAGTSRQFTFQGAMTVGAGTSPALRTFSITSVNYGTTTTGLTAGVINYNLQPLKVTATF